MSIVELGALGEFVGAFAVVGTLIYLAYQIGQSRALLLSNAYQARTDAVTSIYLALAQDASLANLLGRANRGEDLSDDEQLRCTALVGIGFRNFENNHLQHQLGLLTDEQFKAVEMGLRGIFGSMPIYLQEWSAQKVQYTKSYVEWVDSLIAES